MTGSAAMVVPPALPQQPSDKASPGRSLLVVLLSLCLSLFLADAVVSLVDDSLNLFFDVHILTGIRSTLFLFAALIAILIYGLMGLTPMIPKRLFLPLTLFSPVALLAMLPLLIYFFGHIQEVAWGISVCQVMLGLIFLRWCQGKLQFQWPLVPASRLGVLGFSWWNLSAFLLVNIFVLPLVVAVYLAFCAALAVDHFSDGFLLLRPEGLTVQVRKYVRNDGKSIQLVPMSHIGEANFYRQLSQSFPTNAIILMEGVSDNKNLLTNKITYKRMAKALGVAEQQTEFKPGRSQMVRADVDVEEFTAKTIDFINLATLVHSRGVNAETMQKLMQYSEPHFEEQLLDDILSKRNRRLLKEIHAHLSSTENIIVPWGAAHMPEVAREIQKSGFRLDETHDYVAIRFRSAGNAGARVGREADGKAAK